MQNLELTADAPRSKGLSLLPPVQRRFGRYVLLCRFASGGMANLYLARFAGPGGFSKFVAIKRIHEHLTENEDFVNMFVDEARLAARIEHPNVVQVLELGAVDSSFFIAMEYVGGESLVALLRRTGPPLPVSARIISQAALGLHAAHELRDTRGDLLHVVHRDVSPGNILISYQGVVKVADFGVARARTNLHTTSAGTVKGKFAYMAPEQARSAAIDRRADVFALGIVLYEITTRRRLFKAESEMVTMAKVLNEPITPPSKIVNGYSPALEQVVMRALQRDRDKRYQSAEEFHEALEGYISDSGTTVLQSRIGELMQRVFADRVAEKDQLLRRSEEELVEEEIADLPHPETPSASSFPLDGTASAARSLKRRHRVTQVVLLTGLVLVGFFALGVLLERHSAEDARPAATAELPARTAPVEQRPAAAVTPLPPAEVRILVKVIPAGASITFDGEPVSNPHRARLVAQEGRAYVVATAPGYVTRRFDVSLKESSRWVIALDHEPIGSPEVGSKSKQTRSGSAAVEKRPARRRRSAGRRPAAATASKKSGTDRLFDNPYEE